MNNAAIKEKAVIRTVKTDYLRARNRRFAPLQALLVLVLVFYWFVPAPAWAVGSVLSGMFDGAEPAIAQLSPAPPDSPRECADTPMGYRQSTFEVSASGIYSFKNAFRSWNYLWKGSDGVDVTALVYQDSFDAAAPEQNLIAPSVFDYHVGEADLSVGKSYILVVQQWCLPAEGAWAMVFTGPGAISSDDAVQVPSFTSGAFAESDPILPNNCFWDWDTTIYSRSRESGPIRVSRDGLYYFSDSGNSGLCFSVYSASVNPEDSFLNLLSSTADGWEPVELQAGRDYYFLVQRGDTAGRNEYFYVLAPPAPFRVNHGLADSWYNPDTPGQGFYLDVFEQLNQVFLGWFTFAIEPSADGAFDHQWLTAFGPFSGTSAELGIEWTTGGAFDSAEPIPVQQLDGTIELEFTNCTSGLIHYSWGDEVSTGPLVSGVIPIQRIANDAVALCESLYRGPGIPGPL
jgi:hypothetical protein